MDLGLSGRKALVTGASAGLGLACARALAVEGAEVALVSRSEARLDEAARSIPGAITFAADVAEIEQRRAMMHWAEQELGPVDIVIANAGGSQAFGIEGPYLTLNWCVALVGIYPSRS